VTLRHGRPPIPDETNKVSGAIIDAALDVHTHLGRGLLESVYRRCLAYELGERGLKVLEEEAIPVAYKGITMPFGFRADIVVEKRVLVEVKACQALHPVHRAQVLNYLHLSGLRVGLLFNFNEARLRDGWERLAV
jgi:GxxExxY protein